MSSKFGINRTGISFFNGDICCKYRINGKHYTLIYPTDSSNYCQILINRIKIFGNDREDGMDYLSLKQIKNIKDISISSLTAKFYAPAQEIKLTFLRAFGV